MSYCPECGSEVANQDPFCAYCGISLEVVDDPAPSEPELPVKTPKLGEPEAVKTSASIADDIISAKTNIDDEVSLQTPLTPPPTPHILADEPYSETIVESDVLIQEPANIDVIPTELIEDYHPIPEEIPVSTEEIIVPPIEEIENEEEDLLEEIEISSENIEVEEIIPSEVIESNETVEDIKVEIAEKPPELGFESGLEDNFDATIVDSTPAIIKSEPIIETVPEPEIEEAKIEFEEPIIEDEKVELEPDEPVIEESYESEIAPIPEPPMIEDAEIEPPLEDVTLIQYDLFDKKAAVGKSVNPFVQNVSRPKISPQVEGDVAPPSEPLISPEIKENKPVNVEDKVVVSANIEDKDSRSYTNPNIGVGDTGGKGRKKLKPLDEGTILNSRYEIVRKIGGGGMGAVYLASDKNLGGVLRAVKEMVQSYIADEQQEKAINDFKRESMLLTSLEHSAIPTIYDYFYDEKEARFYLVMKYISGGDLAARLKAAPEGRIDEVSITDWAIQIADVLDYLHNRQPPIVYRDLKPSNIMIDGNSGKVMIIDFGIARWVNKEEKGVTAVGTMGYAPPELFSGNVEPRSDIYSLGSTMFHLLTGADPQSNPLLIFDFNKHPRPRQINSQLTDQMEQIIMRSVEYNSAQRFSSAQEMRNELIKHLDNLKKGTVTFGIANNAAQPVGNVPVFCGFCGQKIVASDMFCPFCGAQQPLAGQSQKQPAYAAPPVTARLLIIGTSDLNGMEYPLEKESNLLGRRDPMSNIFPEVDVSKFDPQTKISRRHARIWRDGDIFMLEDLGSSNGTVLIQSNNEQIRLLPRQPQILTHGDKVRLGDTTLQFSLR